MARSKSKIYGVEVEGMEELKAQIRNVENVPKRAISKAARNGMRKPLADARKNAPEDTGTLKKGIRSIMEGKTRRNKGKTVYRMVFNWKYTPIFRGKKIKRPGLYGANPPKKYGYYPFSMEYGYKAVEGKRPGRKFIADAIENNKAESFQKVIDTLSNEIDKAIKKG